MVAVTVPFSLLFAFICMRFTNIPANLLSLGAIDFGIIVDASIVVMENILRHREENPDWVMSETMRWPRPFRWPARSSSPRSSSLLRILPLFAFQRVEKKLFSPMAYVVGLFADWSFADGAGNDSRAGPGDLPEAGKPFHNPVLAFLSPPYERAIRHLTHHPMHAIIPAVVAGLIAVVLSVTIGKEFLPYLDEGSLWLQVQLPPGLSLEKPPPWLTNFALQRWNFRKCQPSSVNSAAMTTAPTRGRPRILSVLSA